MISDKTVGEEHL